jgi:hypothetical protein
MLADAYAQRIKVRSLSTNVNAHGGVRWNRAETRETGARGPMQPQPVSRRCERLPAPDATRSWPGGEIPAPFLVN